MTTDGVSVAAAAAPAPGGAAAAAALKRSATSRSEVEEDGPPQQLQEPSTCSLELSKGVDPESTDKLVATSRGVDAAFTMRGLFQFAGTGFLAAVAYLDPGNLEADISVGVGSGYSLLWWFAVCTLGFGFMFQVLSGKLGLVTGSDLAFHVGTLYPRPARILLWALLELSILAADVQETVGCALALRILSNGALPLWAACIIVSLAAFALLQVDRFGFRNLEFVYAALILLEAAALTFLCFSVRAPAAEVAKGFIPRLSADTVVVAAGALGALVMPYTTFFQSHVINARERDRGTDAKKKVLIKYMKIEMMCMLLVCFLLNVFVVVIFAQFYGMEEYEEAGLESAGVILTDTFGDPMQLLWAIGLLASGLVATICLTYAGQVIMVGLLQIRVEATYRLLVTRFISLLPCLILAVVFEATNTFDRVAQIINVVQSLMLPFGLIPIAQVATNRNIMGDKWVNHNIVTVLCWVTIAAVAGVDVFSLCSIAMETVPQEAPAWYALAALVILVYMGLVTYFAVGPTRWPSLFQRGRSNGHALFIWLKTNRRWADIESMLEVHY